VAISILSNCRKSHGLLSKRRSCAVELKETPLPLAVSGSKLDVRMWQLCKEFLSFLKQEKKWWLIPLVVFLLMLAGLIIFSGSSVLAPFMYPFM
jgi:hypothetical protein